MAPTILLLHGAWLPLHPCYDKLIGVLKNHGFNVVAPQLPTANGAIPPTTGLEDDVQCVQNTVTQLIEAGNRVLVVCHSYGGAVATEALQPELALDARHRDSQNGGVVGIVAITAFLPQKGESVSILFSPATTTMKVQFDEDGSHWLLNAPESVFSDAQKDEAQRLSQGTLPHPSKPGRTPTTHEAWASFPTTYIFCENDLSIMAEAQLSMINKIKSRGVDMVVEKFQTGHCPWVAKPEETASAIERAWMRYTSELGKL